MDTKYLKPKQHYVDRYDNITIERCRGFENAITTDDIKKRVKTKDKKELDRLGGALNEFHLYFIKGEMYKNKASTIDKWIREDEERDRFCETAEAPKGITCLACSRDMFVSFSSLETNLDEPDRMLYMYDCTLGHLPRRAFYDNGEEWKREEPKCSKCSAVVEEKDETTEEMFKTTLTCPSCGNVEVREIERTANKEEKEDPNFEKDRVRFCDDEEGRKYIEWMHTAKELTKVLNKQKEKDENKELYDKVEKLKKLSVPQVKQYLIDALENEPYTDLVFEQPTIERIVSVGFSIEDPTDQGEYDSRTKLTRAIKKALQETNWRLMSEGISCRLGVLTGRIRVYEKEEDLVKLIK